MKKHVSLSAGKTVKLTGKQLSFVCNEGTAWITNPGDAQDYIMKAGDSLELTVKSNRGSIVVSSMRGQVELEIVTPL